MNAPVSLIDSALPRHDRALDEVMALFDLPFTALIFQAAAVHRRWFDPTQVQMSQLQSVKTGGCVENYGYCSQPAHFDTGLKASKLMKSEVVIEQAARAKAGGASRFCMGAAWRDLKDRDLPELARMIGGVKALGLETCATLGMLTADQAKQLKDAGLDYYNHNLDTGPEDYARVVTTRTYQDRLDTLSHVRDAGMSTCCGGIVGGNSAATAPACCTPWQPCRPILTACRSTDWCPSAAPRWARDHEPRTPGAVFPGRRQFDLRGRHPVDHA